MPKQNSLFIPDISKQQETGSLLTAAVVVQPVKLDPTPYKISFEHYISKDCGINSLIEKCHYKKALNWLKQAGMCTEEDGIRSIAIKPDDDKTVVNEGWYSDLFKNLPEEVETIREYKLSHEKGRLFYYVDPALKIIYCVLIHQAHFETDKNKK